MKLGDFGQQNSEGNDQTDHVMPASILAQRNDQHFRASASAAMLAFTNYAASEWDWVALILIESACGVFLLLTIFWLPISDWLMRRRIRKEEEYQSRLRLARRRKFELIGKSRLHGRN
jgi:hypothetical protein